MGLTAPYCMLGKLQQNYRAWFGPIFNEKVYNINIYILSLVYGGSIIPLQIVQIKSSTDYFTSIIKYTDIKSD